MQVNNTLLAKWRNGKGNCSLNATCDWMQLLIRINSIVGQLDS